MVALTAAAFSSSTLGVGAASGALLYQRTGYNVLNAKPTDAVNIGTLATNSTQLSVTGQVANTNQTSYYKFNLQGKSLKLSLDNLTNVAKAVPLRVKITDSTGKILADNKGTTAQQAAYKKITSADGLGTNSGNYTASVTYAPTSTKTNPQSYALNLYSGTRFDATYQTTAVAQTSLKQAVPVDNTQTYATSDAQLFTTGAYHKVNETALTTDVNIGWLYENKSALSVESKLTNADSNEFYKFTLETNSPLKFAFNQTSDQTNLRVQVLDSTGTAIIADSEGTTAQKQAYTDLTSSKGLNAKAGQYAIKVTYGAGADHTKSPIYNFKLYAGSSYQNLYKTTATPETYGHAALAGNLGTGSYNAKIAAATYLYNQSQGDTSTTDIMSAISTAYSSTIV